MRKQLAFKVDQASGAEVFQRSLMIPPRPTSDDPLYKQLFLPEIESLKLRNATAEKFFYRNAFQKDAFFNI